MEGMIFWGATGQAKVLRDCMIDSGLRLVAVFDNDSQVRPPFEDVPLHIGTSGFDAWLREASGKHGFLVAIGGSRGLDRCRLQQFLVGQGLEPLRAIHRSAFVAPSAKIDAGCQVLAGSTVCVDVQLGPACIVNTGASLDHECVLEEGVHVAPGAVLAGCVRVGAHATIWSGATILPHVVIGAGAEVGAGAVVLEDVEPFSVVAGNPARLLRRKDGQK